MREAEKTGSGSVSRCQGHGIPKAGARHSGAGRNPDFLKDLMDTGLRRYDKNQLVWDSNDAL
jgi:hypothetical protein